MLVLSRRSNESVIVGRSDRVERTVRITVIEIREGSVRLGFETSADTPVHRSEIWEQLHGESRANGVVNAPGARPRPSERSGRQG